MRGLCFEIIYRVLLIVQKGPSALDGQRAALNASMGIHPHQDDDNCRRLWGLSQILCKRRNAVQIEQNLFKAEVAQAAAALFSK